MPYDTGTSQLINQLTNPPNPFEQYGKTLNFAAGLRQFQANQAGADAYRQAVDPVTGALNMGKFNSLMAAGPGAYNLGAAMQQAGQGYQAQGLGTQANVKAVQDQLRAAGDLMYPLYKDAASGKSVPASEVEAVFDQAYNLGLVNPQIYQRTKQTLGSMDPNADAGSIVLGVNMANQAAHTLAFGNMPIISQGGTVGPVQSSAIGAQPAPGSTRIITPTPGEVIGQNQWLATPTDGAYQTPDGQWHRGTREQWLTDFGNDPSKVRWGAGGSITAPGAPPFFPSYGAGGPSAAPAALPQAPSAAPSPGPAAAPMPSRAPVSPPTPSATGPSATPQPPPPGPQSNVNQPTPPLPAGQKPGGGPVVMPESTSQAGEAAYNAAVADMPNSQARRTTIALALQALPGAAVGGGTENIRAIRNVLGTYSPDFIRKIIPDYDPAKAATDDQLATKYMQQITNASIPGGQGTNEKLQAAAQATPNPHMQEQASSDVLQVMDAGELMKQHMLKQFQATGQPPAKFAQWSANWATTHDPRAFMLPFMTPEQTTYLQSTMKPGTPAAKAFNRTVHELVQNNEIPDPTKTPGMTE